MALFTEIYHTMLCLPLSYETCDTYKWISDASNFNITVMVKVSVKHSKNISSMPITLHSDLYHIGQVFGEGKFGKFLYQKLLASKTVGNSCLFAFFINVMRYC